MEEKIINNNIWYEVKDINALRDYRKGEMGCVYIFECGNIVKIGKSGNIFRRINHFIKNEKNSEIKIKRIFISCLHANYSENEILLHNLFQKYKYNITEFFNISVEEIFNKIKSIDIKYTVNFKKYNKMEYNIAQPINKLDDKQGSLIDIYSNTINNLQKSLDFLKTNRISKEHSNAIFNRIHFDLRDFLSYGIEEIIQRQSFNTQNNNCVKIENYIK